MKDIFASDVRNLQGVGAKRRQILADLGINTFADLLMFLPARYRLRQPVKPLGEMAAEETALVQVTVSGAAQIRYLERNRSLVQIPVADDSGQAVAIWFNQPYRRLQFARESRIWLQAKLELFQGQRRLMVRECGLGLAPASALLPVYSLRGALAQGQYIKLVEQVLGKLAESQITEVWPPELRQSWRLPALEEALRQLHSPASAEHLARARRRLAFDKTCYERAMSLNLRQRISGYALPGNASEERKWRQNLPFVLTAAQESCIAEIVSDMGGEAPMRRLLQGDVGSGKTAVAAAAILRAVTSGKQAVLLAPTEVLAKQHFLSLRKLLPDWLDLYLVVGNVKSAEHKALLESSTASKPALWVGTHALLQEGWQFPQLGLVVVDEQHRFGVAQRQKLLAGRFPSPDLLCLSATPIPRTLALALYGDLSVSNLEQRPEGRQRIRTIWLHDAVRLEKFLAFCASEFSVGHKMYWVCPSIDADPELDLSSVNGRAPVLREIWPDTPPLVLHGRLNEEARQQAIESFLYGEAQLLLGTTVVEVGLDQPLATVIVIENAARFGLAQLHQLRGRVGRSNLPSYCVLLAGSLEQLRQGEEPELGAEAAARLKALCSSDDGFELARLDLELRGPGEVFGLTQSGFIDSYALSWPLGAEDLDSIDHYLTTLKQAELDELIAKLENISNDK